VAGIGVALSAVAGIAVAAALASRWRGRDVVDTMVTLPMVLPPTVLGYYLLTVLGRSSPAGAAFESLTGTSIVFTRTGAVLAAAIGAFPLIVKSARAALESVDGAVLAAARTLGAGPARAFFTVRLPLAKRGVAAGLMLGFARALGDFGVTMMIAGNIPGETQTASLAIYDAVLAGREADAIGMIATLSAIAIGALYGANKLANRHAV
jgi:molybdate transport system permease protein